MTESDAGLAGELAARAGELLLGLRARVGFGGEAP